jgi:hypothetical protein
MPSSRNNTGSNNTNDEKTKVEKQQILDRHFDLNNLFLKVIRALVIQNQDLNAIIPYINRLRENLMLSADEVEKLVQDVSENPLITMFEHEIFQNRTDFQMENARQKDTRSQERKDRQHSAYSTSAKNKNNTKIKSINVDSNNNNDNITIINNNKSNKNIYNVYSSKSTKRSKTISLLKECQANKKVRRNLPKKKTINDLPLEIQQVVIPEDNKPIVTGVWTVEESKKCHEAFKKYSTYSKHYKIIAKCVGGTRSIKQVRDHIGKIRRTKARKGEKWP